MELSINLVQNTGFQGRNVWGNSDRAGSQKGYWEAFWSHWLAECMQVGLGGSGWVPKMCRWYNARIQCHHCLSSIPWLKFPWESHHHEYLINHFTWSTYSWRTSLEAELYIKQASKLNARKYQADGVWVNMWRKWNISSFEKRKRK